MSIYHLQCPQCGEYFIVTSKLYNSDEDIPCPHCQCFYEKDEDGPYPDESEEE